MRSIYNIRSFVVLAPQGCGAIISITPDFMSYNWRAWRSGRLGAPEPELPQGVMGAEDFGFPHRPPFR